jgi:VWFA-related protein
MHVSTRLPFVALAMLLTAGSSSCLAAQGLAPEVSRPASDASRKITLDVVVDIKNSKPPSTAAGLKQEDFSVLDNKSPRPITSFRAVTPGQSTARVVLLIDAVNIQLQGLDYARNQISAFLRANGGRLTHPTAIAILTDKGLQVEDSFSTDGNAISESLDKQVIGMRTITRSTGIYGAEDRFTLSLNALRLLAGQQGKAPGRTVILWVSPGWPLLSGAGIELSSKQEQGLFSDIVNLSTELRETRVTLYAIDPIGSNESVERTFYYESFLKGIAKPSQVDAGDLGLQVLASQSGGTALNSNDTGALLQRSYADLDNYYEITFDAVPTETRDTYRHVEIKVDKPGMIARTRDGYYAQP